MKNESVVCGAEGCQKVFVVGSEVMVEDKNFPLVGLSRAPIRLRRVVFPAPDGPYIDINSPASTVRSMFFSASTTTSSIRIACTTQKPQQLSQSMSVVPFG